jgi:hypothetical protein
MKTILCMLLLGALTLVAAPDADVTGKWTGSFNITNADGQTKEATAYLVLKQSGSDITGTVGPDEGEQHNITKGKIEGDKITLLVEDEGRTITFDLVLTADRIKGDVNMSHDGQTGKAKLDVGRAK